MTVVNQQYRKLNPAGGTPREISEVVNNLMDGKSNNTGSFRLESANASETTIYNERVGYSSTILLSPTSITAASDYLPYGSFQSDQSQTIASTTTAYVMTFNITDFQKQISMVSSSRFTVEYAGLYNLQFSAQFTNSSVFVQDISIWFRKNGTDIPASNSEFSIANQHGAVDGRLIAALNFYVPLDEDEYVEIVWSATSTSVQMQNIPTQTSPTRPSSPSVIATIQYVSSDGYAENTFSLPYISSKAKGSFVVSHPYNDLDDKTYDYIVVG